MHKSYLKLIQALVLVLLVAPIWVPEVPPLVDLPNHAARINILANYEGNEFYQRNFELVLEPIPNVALDILAVPLTKVFGIWTTLKIFLTIVALTFFLGCQLIAMAAHGRTTTLTAFAAPFLLYGGTFFYGYLNYVLSVSLFLVCFGLWMRWRDELSVLRYATLAVLTILVYLSHLSSFAFLALALILYNTFEAWESGSRTRSISNWIRDGALFLLPSIAFVTFLSGSGSVGGLEWAGFSKKLILAISPLISYDYLIDGICYGIFAAIAIIAVARGTVSVHRALLAISGIFFLLFIPAPNLLFTAGDADARIILPAFCLFFLSLDVQVLNRPFVPILILFLSVFGIRQGTVAYRWDSMSDLLIAESRIFESVPRKSFVLDIYGEEFMEQTSKTERSLIMAIALASIDRDIIWPGLFAIRGQHPLAFRNLPDRRGANEILPSDRAHTLNNYRYVWVFKPSTRALSEFENQGVVIGRTEHSVVVALSDR
ncbi:MAG: hypothetical protein IPM21_16300 [Acidobacteria bacterium]|nr:hypothetical protein [Acidobacteriota bacterium]